LNNYSKHNIIIFDGLCNLCSTSVKFVIKRDSGKIFKFLPIQSKKANEIAGNFNIEFEGANTVILIKDNQVYYKSDAALKIIRELNYPWKVFYFFKFIPKFVRDKIYSLIANNRYRWFGKRDTCMIPNEDIQSRFLD
jgi:predicted DCC family thiol-disulfide oxidoreductase YuxK